MICIFAPAAEVLAQLHALGPIEAMTMLESVDVRRGVEAASQLALGDAAAELVAMLDHGRSGTKESEALVGSAGVPAEAAPDRLTSSKHVSVNALPADVSRMTELEVLARREALVQALLTCSPPAGAAATAAEAPRSALAAAQRTGLVTGAVTKPVMAPNARTDDEG